MNIFKSQVWGQLLKGPQKVGRPRGAQGNPWKTAARDVETLQGSPPRKSVPIARMAISNIRSLVGAAQKMTGFLVKG